MDIDIQIYLKRIRDFFENDLEARRDMFGNAKINMKHFYEMVTQQAILNSKNEGTPVLSSTQILEIVTDLAFEEVKQELTTPHLMNIPPELEKIFIKYKDGFPPVCLN